MKSYLRRSHSLSRLALATCIAAALGFVACSKSAAPDASGTAEGGSAGQPTERQYKPHNRVADHQVLVFLGPDYATHPEILDGLIREYGLAGYGGMVVKLIYPDSFLVDGQVRLAQLAEYARAAENTVLITVGAPEGTLRELLKMRAIKPELRMVSLFPADDAFQMEAVNSILIEYPSSGDILESENAVAPVAPLVDLDVLMLAATLAAEETDASISPLDAFSTALDASRSLLRRKPALAGWTFVPYVDPETGLRSRTHLLLTAPAGYRSPTVAPNSGGSQ